MASSQKMPEETLLKVSHIDVFHGSFQALWDVSLTIRPGEIVAIIGANGSGKSTLLDTISGLVHPAKGSIEFEGKDISALEPFHIVDLGISQVPEGRRVFPDLTVLENLIIGSYNRKARSKREQNLQRAYHLFPVLKERKSQLAKTLSGGEQQMLSLGRGLMSDPKLILLDEMSLGLAPILINELYRILREIRDRGITILFVEQNVRRSLTEADRAYIMEVGRVVLSGDVAKLREEERVKKAYFGA
ncbi:MAG: ABC transporter ATP-binding protein [Dehalococcoidales bacterium]|nr:ABC transporter ATP-binding protein [Dehalococcoidales bacterium]